MKVKNLFSVEKFRLWFWGIFAFVGLFIVTIFILIGAEFFGPMPTFEELENPKSNIATEIISEDNVVLGNFFVQNRTFVNYDEISPNVINALIATEDVRFQSHSGIDFRGLGRVMFKTILFGKKTAGGGSTITQQLAKNLFPRDTASNSTAIVRKTKLVITKFKEWITAVKLERNYTKEEIIAMYLNIVEFGSNSYGIKSAAKTFFNTNPDSLKIEEAALLVGVVNAPSRYSPTRNPERSIQRRNVVLKQMERYNYITEQQYDSISKIPITLDFKTQDHNAGLATYFREMIRLFMTSKQPDRKYYYSYDMYREDSLLWETNPLYGWCYKNAKPDGTPYNIYRDGLKIYTTINSHMQEYAENSLKDHLKTELQPVLDQEIKARRGVPYSSKITPEQANDITYLAMRQTERYRLLRNAGATKDSIYANFNTKTPMTVFTWNGERDTIMTPLDSIKYYKKFLRSSFMAMDPHNGHIKAYVGGPDFRHFKYDMVKQGKRQVGSTIKPFLYTLAMQEGYSPCLEVPNVPQTFITDTTWTPKNSANSKYDGKMVTLKWGLANSVNNISAWVMKQFTPEAVVEMIKQLGIHSRIDPVYSIFLGTFDFSLYEMVGAYGTFANKGVHVEPIFVTRIEDRNGNVLAQFNTSKTEAISDQTAYLMINLLESVVNQGTAIRLHYKYQLTGHIGGKTGTTQNHSDGWFMGVTPNLVAGVWTGAEDRAVHFDNIRMGQGASMALPIFATFLQKVYADPSLGITPEDNWDKPVMLKNLDLNCDNKMDNEEINEIELF
ncbi:MAG: penicillin-binding protein 1A [Bacteroidales bacterium]